MKLYFFYIFLFTSCLTNAQVNTDFEKNNFPNQKDAV